MSCRRTRTRHLPSDAPSPGPHSMPRSILLDHGELIDRAMALEWDDTVRRHRRLRAPLYCCVDGGVQAIDPHTISLQD